jgi:hypothetical protein
MCGEFATQRLAVLIESRNKNHPLPRFLPMPVVDVWNHRAASERHGDLLKASPTGRNMEDHSVELLSEQVMINEGGQDVVIEALRCHRAIPHIC